MNNLLKQLLLGGSATALVAGASFTAALAQDALDVETVQSSVSRIDLKGFEAPTPVTVVGIEQINRDAKVQIGEQLRELPQIRGGGSISAGTNSGNLSQINAGADTVAIRGLGTNRNLVLFDRQRVVTSTIQDGAVDLSLIPQGLVQRIDVVTGGASAVWGSDAVTGVVNIVINKTFQGFKGNATYSDNTEVENPQYRASLAWGTSFLGGKGHIVAAADWTFSNKGVFPGDLIRSNVNRSDGRGLVYNPAYCSVGNIAPVTTAGGTSTCTSPNPGQTAQIYAYGVSGNLQSVQGGLTTGNTAGTTGSGLAAGSLKNVMFVGENAEPQQFYTGTVSNTTTCYNGCTNDQYGTGGWGPAKNAYHSGTYFTYASYQILPDVKASIQLNYARLSQRAYGNQINGNSKVIYADNPYIPDSIAQRFTCNGTQSASCQTVLSNGYNPYTKQYDATLVPSLATRQSRPSQTMTIGFEFSGGRPNPSPSATDSVASIPYSYDEFCDTIYQNCGFYHKAFMRGVFTLDGVIGDSWTWTAYIGHSNTRIKENVANPVFMRFNNALDAVRVTSGNVGTSGLPIGSIQCRGLLNASQSATFNNATQEALAATYGFTRATEVAGCTPFNPFGLGEVTNATRNYVIPGLNPAKNDIDTVIANMQQESAAFSMSGVLPWTLPAGEIGVAFGGEWRIDRHGQYKIDPRSTIGMYPSGNFGGNFEGKQHAEEGFLELSIPILKNEYVQSLGLDLAGRLTNYSNSGLVETWKIGVQSQINDDVRFRMTWSHDIRAPTVWDLAAPPALAQRTCASFIPGPAGSNGGQPNACFDVAGGNPTLNPERANTIAAGFVFSPTFIPGLTASIDWYRIILKGGITTPGFNDVINRCRAGELVYCPSLSFVGGSYDTPGATATAISTIQLRPVNAGGFTTAGFDFNVAYGFDLFTGSADVSFNGNHNYEFSRLLNGVYFDGAGCTGCYYSGNARFQGNVNFNYREGPWSFGIQVRLTGDSVSDRGDVNNSPDIQERGVVYNSAGVATITAGQTRPGFNPTNYNPWQATTDLRLQYRWSNNITLFGNVDNIQNLPYGGTFRRAYRMGVRFNY
jgi:outer membrane receptor protein involved in Fe transport